MADTSNILSFLSNGQVTPPQPTGSDSATGIPDWLNQFSYNLGNTANNLVGTDQYNPATGQQVASPSGATQGAWNLAQNNLGQWQPALGGATSLTQASASPIDPSAISGYTGALTGTGINSGQQFTGALNSAVQNGISGYTNPYMSQVVGGIEGALNQNLTQNVLPGIQDRFVSAGQSASPQEAQLTAEAVGQNQTAVGNAIAPYLAQGYQGALNTALGTANTGFGAGTGATTSGLNTATGQQANQRAAGAQLGVLGQTTQQLGAGDAGSLAAVGQAQDTVNQANLNAASTNATAQQQYPYQQLGYASNIIRGVPYGTTTQTSGLTYAPGTGGYAASPLATYTGVAQGASALGLRKGGTVKMADGGALNQAVANDDTENANRGVLESSGKGWTPAEALEMSQNPSNRSGLTPVEQNNYNVLRGKGFSHDEAIYSATNPAGRVAPMPKVAAPVQKARGGALNSAFRRAA